MHVEIIAEAAENPIYTLQETTSMDIILVLCARTLDSFNDYLHHLHDNVQSCAQICVAVILYQLAGGCFQKFCD